MGTVTSNSKSKSKKVSNSLETDDNTPTRVIDFSSGRPLFQVTSLQIITGVVFIFGLGWFVASQWVFDIKSERLKNDISDRDRRDYQEVLKNSNDRLNSVEDRISEVDNQIINIRNKNPYLK
jgi:uncharacterized membrane protein YvbJ